MIKLVLTVLLLSLLGCGHKKIVLVPPPTVNQFCNQDYIPAPGEVLQPETCKPTDCDEFNSFANADRCTSKT